MRRLEKINNLPAGILSGAVLTFAIYFLSGSIARNTVSPDIYLRYFSPPKLQLYDLFVMIILFRVTMINLKLHNFGRGMLIAMVLISFGYYFFYKKHIA